MPIALSVLIVLGLFFLASSVMYVLNGVYLVNNIKAFLFKNYYDFHFLLGFFSNQKDGFLHLQAVHQIMMIKAFFVDFYGTLVHEDGEVIKKITDIICNTGKVENKKDVDTFWWSDFQTMFTNSFGDVSSADSSNSSSFKIEYIL